MELKLYADNFADARQNALACQILGFLNVSYSLEWFKCHHK